MRTRANTTPTSTRLLLVYLAALVGREPNGLLEVRWRHNAGMKRRVYRVTGDLAAAAHDIERLGLATDVYVGCAPRRQRPGGLDAIGRVWVLWVDCDNARAIRALEAFRPAPSMVVRSGSGENRHAYWTLSRGLSTDQAAIANQRLAHTIGADTGAVTNAATILRPPGTANFKHNPAAAVAAVTLQPWRRIDPRSLVEELPDAPAQHTSSRHVQRETGAQDDDALRRVAPMVYVEALTGLRPGRDGKISCPFHGDDRTPSLHVYDTPEAGWYCFGCRRGGSLFDLAAEVFGLSTRGRDFIELRKRLQTALAAWSASTQHGHTSTAIDPADGRNDDTSS